MSGLILTIGAYDERLLRALVLQRRPHLDLVMRGVTRFADWPVAVLITLVFSGGFVPGLEAAGAQMAWTLALSHLAVQVLKRCFSRERPHLGTGMQWLVTVPDRFSFPSGHSAAAMSMALPLFLALPGLAGPLVLLLGVWVGLSRCYLGVHFPGDVAAGWGLAAATLAGVQSLGL